MNKMKDILTKILGAFGLLLGPLFLPIVFAHVFAMGSFSLGEILASGTFAFALVGYSVLVLLGMVRSEKIILISLSVYSILALELGSRLMIKSSPKAYEANKLWSNSTYTEEAEFMGHPFHQFTGPKKWYRGFPTVFPENKKTKTRIVAIGGSTTATGYPARLNDFLGNSEVLNFGQAFFTSTHSMINYFINIVDLKPDYLVIHQGWNDSVVRNSGDEFRSDYAHALKAWELPFIPDLYLIRFSALYRYLKDKFTPFPSWRFIDSNLKVHRTQNADKYDDLTELEPFKRNIRSIIVAAKSNGTKVILTTQPHVTKGKSFDAGLAKHIQQCNQIMRKLAREFAYEVLIVDLFKHMQGQDKLFKDLGHMTEEGLVIKAQHIGRAIKEDLLKSR